VKKDYPQTYKWYKNYAVVKDGAGGFLLVVRPMNVASFNAMDEDVDHDEVLRMSYFELAYHNIKEAHGTDHCKGNTLLFRVSEKIANIGHNVGNLFIGTTPSASRGSRKISPYQESSPSSPVDLVHVDKLI
jgi:hypothetical protein